MKVTKKTIISNTILFIGIVGFIMAFGAVFGEENILIGVSTITAMLMLLERDLTSHPVGNTLKFVLLNLFIGITAFLTGFNTWLAIPIHFIAMFVISYTLLFNLKNPLYLPFSLQYLFILATPVAIDQMPLRLTSLVFGALAIMGIQMLANKNKITKSGDQKINAILSALIEKATQLKVGPTEDSINEQIKTDISGLRSVIYDKREENYYLTEEGRLKLNMSVSLEKINALLDSVSDEIEDKEVLENILYSLQLALDSLSDEVAMTELQDSFDNMLTKYKAEHNHSLLILRMLNTLDSLRDILTELKALGKEQFNVIKNLEHIPKKFQKLRISEHKSHTNSIKLSYAVRMAVAISFTGFLVDYFEITEGRWMMFTVLSVIIPIYEQSTKKMRDRVFATFIGALLVTGFFMIFQGHLIRSILLMTAGYLMSYVKVYRYSTILVTFSAIGSVALVTGSTEILTLHRVELVVAGVVIALLINKFILPYKMEDANNDLQSMHQDTIREMLSEAIYQVKGHGKTHVMKNLLLISNMIEDRLKLNNQGTKSDTGIAWLQNQRRTASTIYELYWWIQKHGIDENNSLALLAPLELLVNPSTTEQDLQKSVTEMKEHLLIMPRIEDRMVLSMILEITEDTRLTRVIESE